MSFENKSTLTRDEAFELVKKYNKDTFHIRHALTVEGVMRWFAADKVRNSLAGNWMFFLKKHWKQ